ncbi:MAG: Lrp/AsnC family transcriptional regulator [Anaerolineae bacterium]
MRGFVLVNTQIGEAPAVAQQLRSFPEVRSADMVIGPYDIVAVVEVPDTRTLSTLVNEKIHGTPGVNHTITMLSLEP